MQNVEYCSMFRNLGKYLLLSFLRVGLLLCQFRDPPEVFEASPLIVAQRTSKFPAMLYVLKRVK